MKPNAYLLYARYDDSWVGHVRINVIREIEKAQKVLKVSHAVTQKKNFTALLGLSYTSLHNRNILELVYYNLIATFIVLAHANLHNS